MKNFITAALACLISVSVWAGTDKHYDRNQLPQLNEQIIADSDFAYELKLVPTSSIIPVQTQRVPNLKKQEKRMIKAQQDTYRPLVIDQQFYLVDGHHRLDALTEMGIPETRVIQIAADIEQIVVAFSEYQEDVPVVEKYTQVAQPNMEEVVVVGTWANLQNAADKQFAEDRIISVVDSDALGNFPDSTAADAIRRLSGVNVENDQGEGRYVTIRGMSSDLNSVCSQRCQCGITREWTFSHHGWLTHRTVRQHCGIKDTHARSGFRQHRWQSGVQH